MVSPVLWYMVPPLFSVSPVLRGMGVGGVPKQGGMFLVVSHQSSRKERTREEMLQCLGVMSYSTNTVDSQDYLLPSTKLQDQCTENTLTAIK